MGEASRGRIIWVDCEMTGLDVSSKTIVEIACVVTDADLTVLITGIFSCFKFKGDSLKCLEIEHSASVILYDICLYSGLLILKKMRCELLTKK